MHVFLPENVLAKYVFMCGKNQYLHYFQSYDLITKIDFRTRHIYWFYSQLVYRSDAI